METTTPTGKPCADCGTSGGIIQTGSRKPWRGRGLCRLCYRRHEGRGTLGRYALLPRLAPPVACLGCGLSKGRWNRGRGLCGSCYMRAYQQGIHTDYPACGPVAVPYSAPSAGWRHVTIPTGLVTPAMLGIRADQPPTDPGCTPKVVWAIGNTNARRALQWLTAHTGIEETQALARVVWMPAQPEDTERRAA